MPSEKKNKKHKSEQKASTTSESLKPLGHYVSDRLELTKQLFSCLKNSQIKQRLPPNLQNKSIERIQQICLDEILGISTKRLLSIINNTRCPENTDSDDSEIEKVDEHISLEEISSDSEADSSLQNAKPTAKKSVPEKATKNNSKTPKEMTMLELLELQARARAIRSQLALEPVTKIELDSDDDDKEEETRNGNASTSKDDENKVIAAPDKRKSAEKVLEKNPQAKNVIPPPPPPMKTKVTPPAPSAKPVKLKRNYKSQKMASASPQNVVAQTESAPIKGEEAEAENNDDRCSSPDVINMDPSPETFFISDSDDEPPPKKSTPERKEKSPAADPVDKAEKEVCDELEDGEVSEKSSRENSPEKEKPVENSSPVVADQSNENAMNDDDVIHLTCDTEIELHNESDQEDEVRPVVSVDEKPIGKSEEKQEPKAEEPRIIPKQQHAILSDDDVVEINNSSDDEMMNEIDKPDGETSTKNNETWEDRWLTSSKTQNILKTTQLASKVRGNIIKTKKSLKADEKKKAESEKVMEEKVLNLEEGSMEQFEVIKNNQNSSSG